jgi:protoheme IX farnesyltransferase
MKYWSLIKSYQTVLLLLTGVAGYLSFYPSSGTVGADGFRSHLGLLSLLGSLFFSISGSTVLNMWYDRDIDAKMKRTCNRPLTTGKVSSNEALVLGLALSILGIGWALGVDLTFGLVVFAGLFIDVFIYTIWLKRRTAWSIVWGGIAGGMPILAGRVLAIGHIDGIGILLCLAVLFWIPTHILTFNMRYFDDYQAAGVPTFPARYGFNITRKIIALSSIFASLAMIVALAWIGLTAGALRLVVVLSAGLFFLAATSMLQPSDRLNFGLFKYASLYMLSTMFLVIISRF